ncbi:MAG: NAD(P)-dependent oxidoreductase [Deltaproteobacteria bacterium]
MRNLIFGSEGFVGNPLALYLEELGEEVVRFDIKRNPLEDLRQCRIDLSGIDRVYFLAWEVGGAKYLYEQDSQFHQLDWNLRLLINVMPQLQASQIPFLFISSQLAEEYDTVYGVTKRLGEVWTHLMNGVRVRLWNVYGPLEKPSQRTHVISDFVHQAVIDKRIVMLTTGDEKRQFIHINDVCRAFHKALDLNPKGIYDVSSFEWVSIMDVAKIIAEEAGAEIVAGQKVGDTPITPMKGRVPGWLPEVDLQQGLCRMVNELQSSLSVKKSK